MSKYGYDEVSYVKINNLDELQDIADYVLDREWEDFFSLRVSVNGYPLYAEITRDKVVWGSIPMTNKGDFISVAEYLSEDLPNPVYAKHKHYTITFGDTTLEVTGEVTITGEEGTWTFGKE